jgi:DNA-binding transcriptional ArsR family regulator
MKKHLALTLLIISAPLFIVSCVSSLLKDGPPTFSNEIKITSPQAPYNEMKTSVFPSWKNTKSGNVISIISDCNENSYYKLSNLHQLVEDSLESITLIKEEPLVLQNKPAASRHISALLDGHQIEVKTVSFKRKSCGYVTSLSGKTGQIAQDQNLFNQFISGFIFE